MFRIEKRKSRKWFIGLWFLIFGFGFWARQCVLEEAKWNCVYDRRTFFRTMYVRRGALIEALGFPWPNSAAFPAYLPRWYIRLVDEMVFEENYEEKVRGTIRLESVEAVYGYKSEEEFWNSKNKERNCTGRFKVSSRVEVAHKTLWREVVIWYIIDGEDNVIVEVAPAKR